MYRRGLAALAVVGLPLALLLPSSGTAQAPAPPAKSVTAVGAAAVDVKPKDRRSNASIKAAVEAADEAARPKAVDEARERAGQLAQTAGLTLGGVLSISEAQTGFYGPFGAPYGLAGTFGPGKFCGTVRRPVLRRDSNGVRRRVGTRTTRTCRVPPQAVVAVTVTFAAS